MKFMNQDISFSTCFVQYHTIDNMKIHLQWPCHIPNSPQEQEIKLCMCITPNNKEGTTKSLDTKVESVEDFVPEMFILIKQCKRGSLRQTQPFFFLCFFFVLFFCHVVISSPQLKLNSSPFSFLSIMHTNGCKLSTSTLL